jgi:glycosyltransferase involved in cell wall biosynthesis
MKLAVVIPGFQADEGDWCIPVFTNLARVLGDQVELHVFALRYPAAHRTYCIGKVKVHALGAGLVGRRRLPVVSLGILWANFVRTVRIEHKRSPFDAVLGIWATESGWLATRAALSIAVPCVVHLAGGELAWIPSISYGTRPGSLSSVLLGSTLRHADLLTTPSVPIRQELVKRKGVQMSRVRSWAPGVDTEMFTPRTKERGETQAFTFITVGSLVPVKGHTLLLRAAAKLKRMAPELDFHLRVVGSSPLEGELRHIAYALNLGGYVDFLGEARHEALPALFQTSDCFVLGSLHEAQCMAALEAMACGIPWIGPRVGVLADLGLGTKELGASGVSIAQRNPRDFALAMLSVATASQEQRLVWSANARSTVLARYELHQQSKKLLELISCLTPKRLAATIAAEPT